MSLEKENYLDVLASFEFRYFKLSQFAKCLDILASLNFLSDCISGYGEVAVCEPCLWARGLKWKRCKVQHTFEIQNLKDEIQNIKDIKEIKADYY